MNVDRPKQPFERDIYISSSYVDQRNSKINTFKDNASLKHLYYGVIYREMNFLNF